MVHRALIFLVLFCFSHISYSFQNKGYTYNLLRGAIKFPESIENIPMIRVHCMGIKIPYTACEVNRASNEFVYNISVPAHQRMFHILITEKINYETVHMDRSKKQANTIKFLKLNSDQMYKLYVCELKLIEDKLIWDMQEKSIDSDTGQIPDDTIIISYNPAYVQDLESVNTFSLPTIVIKHNVLDVSGSLDKFNDDTTRALLASIDLDSIHTTIDQKVKRIGNRNLIAPS